MPTSKIKMRNKGKNDGHMVKKENVSNDMLGKKLKKEFNTAMNKAGKFGNF